MGFIPNNAINITGTPFNLLVMFKASRVHLKCHIIILVCIAQLPCVDCFSGVVGASVDQGGEVPPPYCDDPYYQHSEQGKRNPPLWSCLILFSANIFSTIILHAVLNVNFVGLEYPIVALSFRCLYLFPPIIHRFVLLAEILTMLCCCLAMLS